MHRDVVALQGKKLHIAMLLNQVAYKILSWILAEWNLALLVVSSDCLARVNIPYCTNNSHFLIFCQVW